MIGWKKERKQRNWGRETQKEGVAAFLQLYLWNSLNLSSLNKILATYVYIYKINIHCSRFIIFLFTHKTLLVPFPFWVDNGIQFSKACFLYVTIYIILEKNPYLWKYCNNFFSFYCVCLTKPSCTPIYILVASSSLIFKYYSNTKRYILHFFCVFVHVFLHCNLRSGVSMLHGKDVDVG